MLVLCLSTGYAQHATLIATLVMALSLIAHHVSLHCYSTIIAVLEAVLGRHTQVGVSALTVRLHVLSAHPAPFALHANRPNHYMTTGHVLTPVHLGP